ncbi:hypothetical protein ONZ45_g7811 [Pleurotus djamor]|nr:hypothetical protein ONZ45_g7811 [Pleurotus djamor]
MPTLSEDEFLGEREGLPPVLLCSRLRPIGCRIHVPGRATSDCIQYPPVPAGPEVVSPVIDPVLLGSIQHCEEEAKGPTSSSSASKTNIQTSGSLLEASHIGVPKGNSPPVKRSKRSIPAFSNRYSDYSLKYIALSRAAQNRRINKDGCATSRPRLSNRITHGLRHSNKHSRSDCSHSEELEDEEEDEGEDEEEDEEEDQANSLDGEIDGETASSDFIALISDHEYDGDDDSSDCSESDDEDDNDKDDEPDCLDDTRTLVTQKVWTATLASSGQIRTYSSSQKTTAARRLVVKVAEMPDVDQAIPSASGTQVNTGQGSSIADHVLTPERIRINQGQPYPVTGDAAHLSICQIKTTPSIYTPATTDLKRKRAVDEEGGEENDELRVRRRSHREE